MQERLAYQSKMRSQLDNIIAQIEKLEAAAKQAEDEAKNKRLEALRLKRVAFEERLQSLQNSSGEAWEELRLGLESAWGELQSALDNAFAKFQ
ncbi:hypothetical protein [Thermostichus vulcanus]|uniref:Coiled coil domain-containing protein n=1 Tax=Thermostichus vulcanus str. 'Rupite' TaxID=2813851 RepID=A0ABT0CE18_THEVL|nr:hypothetical protein [Thermostichus vulcanus]MCJ2544022.1 hypothetical protein [Thermostichus vulcanus str. 'Rupite']